MKFLIALTMLVSSYAAFSQADTNVMGNCAVLEKGEKDSRGYVCNKGIGITFDNKLLGCAETELAAIKEMRKIDVCYNEPKQGNCSILMPKDSDMNAMGCMPSNYLAVTYKGHIINSTACYKNIDNAVKAMEKKSICHKTDFTGEFSILYPYQSDANNQYCRKSFGVAFRGKLATKDCYATIEKAMKAMEKLSDEI